jgi:hypothetical protein
MAQTAQTASALIANSLSGAVFKSKTALHGTKTALIFPVFEETALPSAEKHGTNGTNDTA